MRILRLRKGEFRIVKPRKLGTFERVSEELSKRSEKLQKELSKLLEGLKKKRRNG